MKRLLFLSLMLLPSAAFAQLDPLPAAFVQSVTFKEAGGPNTIDKKIEAMLGAAKSMFYAEVEREGGEAYGQVISAFAEDPSMLKVDYWEVRLVAGKQLIAAELNVPSADLQMKFSEGKSAKLSLAKPLSAKLAAAVRAFRGAKGERYSIYQVRAELVPLEWREVKDQREFSIDLINDLRGTFTLTHTRLPIFETIRLNQAQSQNLLGLKKRDALDTCVDFLLRR